MQDYSSQAAVTASTMAHELGHNFGMTHDESNCECPDSDGQCIMSSFLSKAVTRFSSCSIRTLQNTLERGYAQCLFDEPKQLYGDAICGNGFVEEGEQCDCGTQKECDHLKEKCCNATSCVLLPGAVCSHGECCEDCQVKPKGTLCRDKEMPDDCDLPEYCTGKHEICPEDHHVYDGIPCHKNDGYCYGGVCRNIELQCRLLFGNDIKAGYDWCFERNARESSPFFNCRNDTHGYFPCRKEDVKCGRIHCLSNEQQPELLRGQDRHLSPVTRDGKSWCIAPGFTWGDGRDPQYVEDGTKCAEGKMCMSSSCVPISEAVPTSAYIKCPNNCSGNGVCNSNGNCHCNKGYACPNCKEFGPDQGGSKDSGQGCQEITKSIERNTDDSSRIIIISTTVGAGVLLSIVLIVFLVKFKRRKRSPESSNPVEIPPGAATTLPESLPIDQEPGYETVETVVGEFHKNVATNVKNDEGILGEEFYDDAEAASSGYEIPGQNETYEEPKILPQNPGYTELDKNRRRNTADEGAYQKLRKQDSDYVIPAHERLESYEDIDKMGRNSSGYTELDLSKREIEESQRSPYQKLVKA